MMRRFSSIALPKLPVGHGSICTLSKSVIPLRRIAACHSGCSWSAYGWSGGSRRTRVRADLEPFLPGHEFPRRHGHQGFDDRVVGPGHDDQADPALDRFAGAIAGQRLFGRGVERDGGEAGPFVESAVGPHGGHRGAYLFGSDGRQWMGHGPDRICELSHEVGRRRGLG